MEALRILARRMLETYDLQTLLEISDITEEELVYRLLLDGLIDPELEIVIG